MDFEILDTPRLLLRKLTPEVYDYLYTNYSDEECINHLGLHNHQELVTEKEKHQKGLSAYDRTFLVFQMIEKSSNQVIGMCGFVRHYPSHFRAEFGYALSVETTKRKGYMSEVAPSIIQYGFGKMKLIRIEAMVGSNNIASLKIIDRLGFEKEGCMRQHYHKDGVMEDSLIFSLIKM
ncbi:MAG: GNAT family N-acetyltransferase [Flavobacteriales bacterium]|nr:GNAT family N-acetyltransferase [Flavobacteriales bacterium]